MNDTVYCITHEEVVDIRGQLNVLHFIPKGVFGWDICHGPFATCAPPEMTEEMWDAVFANEPSQDELEAINQNVG